MHKLFFLCFVLLFAGCGPAEADWEYEVGDQVRHVSGVEAVVIGRYFVAFDSTNLRYFIRYRNDLGSLETSRALPVELKPMGD